MLEDRTDLAFFPNAAGRVTDGDGRRVTREIDFIIVYHGVTAILEIDGWPHNGRACYDHARDRAFRRNGLFVIDRVPAAEAMADPAGVVERFLELCDEYAHRRMSA